MFCVEMKIKYCNVHYGINTLKLKCHSLKMTHFYVPLTSSISSSGDIAVAVAVNVVVVVAVVGVDVVFVTTC